MQTLTTDIARPSSAPTLAPAAKVSAPQGPMRTPTGYTDLGYCVGESEITVEYNLNNVVTGLEDLMPDSSADIANVRYYNITGAQSDAPFDGLNIVVKSFTDESRQVEKRNF